MTITAYPLSWPVSAKRYSGHRRHHPSFKATFAKGRDNLIKEIKLLGGNQLIISSNVELRKDGMPSARTQNIIDPGVAIYFTYKEKQMCFACDKWSTVADNMQAIMKTIEALRGIARWGSGDMMESAFSGFTALPNPSTPKPWFEILGVKDSATINEAERAYKELRSIHHPDKGGSAEMFNQLQKAWEQAKRLIK